MNKPNRTILVLGWLITNFLFSVNILFAQTVAVKQWTQQFGTSGDDYGYSVAVDSTGNVYVTGYTGGGLDGNTNAGSYDIFLTKYDSSGTKIWMRQIGTSVEDKATAIAIDTFSNIYITGHTAGGLDGNTNTGNSDVVLVKYNSDGVKQWTRQIGSSSADYGQGIALDSSGNIYITGYTLGGFDGNINAGFYDIFFVKFNNSGTRLWSRQLGSSERDYGKGITVDKLGNIFITGYTAGNLDGNTSLGGEDVFLTMYNSSGIKQWTKQFGSTSLDYGKGIALDSSENIYITGETLGNIDGNINAGEYDIFLVKYNGSGVKIWTRQFGSSLTEWGDGVGIDSLSKIYITGSTWGGLDGNPNVGSNDIFLIKYDTTGNKIWTKQSGSSNYDSGRGVAMESFGNLYTTGETTGGLDGNINAGSSDGFLIKYRLTTPPVLSWTGEPNYISDGINPEFGTQFTTFYFRIKYTDTDNDPPAAGYPKLYVQKSGINIPGSPFTMEPTGSTSYNTGIIYFSSVTNLSASFDYTYYFEVYDTYNAGPSTTSVLNAPDSNVLPELVFTNETGYTQDGVHPDTGPKNTSFRFRIKYLDADNQPPTSGYPKLHILLNEIETIVTTMTFISGTYPTGAIYAVDLKFTEEGVYQYYYEVKDSLGVSTQTAVFTGLIVGNVPVIEMLTRIEQVKPDEKKVIHLKYSDADYTAPYTGYPKLKVLLNGIQITDYLMTVSSGDFTAGYVIYSATVSYTTVSDKYVYYAEVLDSRQLGGIIRTSTQPFIVSTTPTVPENKTRFVDGQSNVTVTNGVKLSWRSTDPDVNSKITYTLYFGEDENTLSILYIGPNTEYELNTLNPGKTYYWQVGAKDDTGISALSPLYNFRTINIAESKVLNVPNPFNPNKGSTNIIFTAEQDGTAEIGIYTEFAEVKYTTSIPVRKGSNSFTYNGRDNWNNVLYNGTYILVVKVDNRYKKTVMMVLKV